jgi:hypothetical protein
MSELKELLRHYSEGVGYPDVSGFEILELLDIRSEIARKEKELSPEEREKLETADGVFLKNAAKFFAAIRGIADLAEMRRKANVSPSHWWWYLEKLAYREKVTA